MESVSIPGNAFSDRVKLGAALRKAGVLDSGARVRTFRVEGNRVVVFPTMPGLTTYWHSIILTFHDRRPNPSMAEVKAHAKRAAQSTADAARRGYAYAKPRAKRAAAATADAARRGYAYAKPRVKAGARWSLSKVSDYAGRGARALERDNPIADGFVRRHVVIFREGRAGPLSWVTVWARNVAQARAHFTRAYGAHRPIVRAFAGEPSKTVTGPRSVVGITYAGQLDAPLVRR